MRASLQLFGDEDFSRQLTFTGRRATQARPLYEELGWWLSYEVMKEQFATEGARSGKPWAPLAPSTVKSKGHDTILVDSDRLRESFKLWDPENVYEATDDHLHFGTKVGYSVFHQPDDQERRVMDLTTADRRHAVLMMRYWVMYGRLRDL